MKRLVLVPSILLAKALFAVELLSPVGGVEVDLVPEVQRTVLALPTLAERIAFFAADRKVGGRAAKSKDWGRARPLVLTWRVAPGEKGPWKVRLGPSRDWTGARIEVFEKAPRDGRVSCVFPQANLELGRRYFWQVSCAKGGGWSFEKEGAAEVGRAGVSSVAEFRTASEAPRWIELEGRARNIRDLGGRMGLGNRRVRQGLVFRGQGLNDNSPAPECRGRNRLTVEDVLYMTKDLGICTELDLRTPQETRLMEGSPLGPDVRRIVVDSEAYRGIFTSKGKKAMAECFRVFCDRKNYPIYFHCISGASRTGSLAYVLNGILGVSRQNLETDWELTYYPNIPDADPNPNRWNRESHFNDGFSRYGEEGDTWNRRIELYLLSCGVTAEEIASFRDVMIEDGTKPVDRSRERNLQKQIDVTAAAGGGKIAFETPFGPFRTIVPEFPARDFSIADYGAKPGVKCTDAIAAAMAACEASGGGRVVVPKGRWLTGAVHFRNGCDLHLENGAELEFTDDPADYLPAVHTTWEGIECMNLSPLLYAYGVTNVAITGHGSIRPRMDLWRTWFARPPTHMYATECLYHWGATNAVMSARDVTKIPGANVRPHLIQFNRCGNVLLEDFSIRESPFWMIHLYHSENCVVRRLDTYAHGHNNDGVDIDMTRNVLVEDCRFDQGDDGIVLKAGRNQDAWRLNRPTENVVVRNCTFAFAHTLLGIGSELSGGVRNVWMHHCDIRRSYNLLYVKTNRRRGGFVENVYISDIDTEDVRDAVFGLKTDVLYQWAKFPDYELRPTRIRNVNVSDVHAVCADYGLDVTAAEEAPAKGLHFRNVRLDSVRKAFRRIVNAEDVTMENVSLSPLGFVDPLIGTEGAGSQYGGMQPYTCVPFGSFHAVPMTRTNRIGRLSFNSSDDTLLGIILTRQPAIWMGDWGEVRVEVPPAKIEKLDAKPYLTRVTAGGRTYEYTATAHAAWIRGLDAASVAAFPESGINTNRMDAKYGYPLPNFGGRWYADKSRPGELKIGLSLISVEQAKANLEKEIGTQTFDEVVVGTKAQWEEMFSRVVIDAPDDVKTIFYTGLYHTLLYPRQMDEPSFAPSAATEAKGRRYYSAFDDKIHTGTRYNCYSLWDTYRAEHPWLTLIAPERVDGMMQSLVDMYKEGGWLPKWPNPSYTGIMVGAPAEVVLREAMVKGFTGFDWMAAQAAIRKNATVPQQFDIERRWEDRGIFGRAPETRAGLTSYLKRGYVACDETAESVSRTQDFSLADRNRNYTNLWCAAEGMFLPRRADGSFVSRKELKPPYHDYCEQQPETGVWAVPHDPEGLADLMGGKAEAIRRLDEFFDTIFFKPDGRGNGTIHGNETSHHCAYLYNRFGAPEKTQQRVRQILAKCYSTNRKGFDGNEDCGQMSAWYIFSALGLYPLDSVSGEYEIGSPIVKAATLKIGAATLRIVVKGYSPTRWRVKRVTFNGRELINWRVRHSDLAAGGDLVFEMSGPCGSTRKDASI